MSLDPFHHLPLIEEPDIQLAILAHTLTSQETPQADSIVECDEDNVLARGFDDLRAVPVLVGVGGVAWVCW